MLKCNKCGVVAAEIVDREELQRRSREPTSPGPGALGAAVVFIPILIPLIKEGFALARDWLKRRDRRYLHCTACGHFDQLQD